MDFHPVIVALAVMGIYLAVCDLLDYAITRVRGR